MARDVSLEGTQSSADEDKAEGGEQPAELTLTWGEGSPAPGDPAPASREVRKVSNKDKDLLFHAWVGAEGEICLKETVVPKCPRGALGLDWVKMRWSEQSRVAAGRPTPTAPPWACPSRPALWHTP